MNVCVVGASGHLGRAVVEELCARQHRTGDDTTATSTNAGIRGNRIARVVAVARNASSPGASRLVELSATSALEVMWVDASQPHEHSSSSYATGLSSAATAISCLAAGYQNTGRVAQTKNNDFYAIDRDANIRFGREAIKAGVKHLLLVATFEGKVARKVSAFADAKEAAVDVLREECKRAGVVFTVLRPTAYFKDLTDRAFQNVLKNGRHLVLGGGSCRINPIAREDVAVFIADCIQNVDGGEYCLGGPDVFTFREIGILAAKVIGNEPDLKIDTFPLWLLRLNAFVWGLFGLCFRSAHRRAALLNWMIYVSTHDAIAPCHGKRRLMDEYKIKYENCLIEEKHKSA